MGVSSQEMEVFASKGAMSPGELQLRHRQRQTALPLPPTQHHQSKYDTDTSSQIFRQNIRLNNTIPMCYVEDVFHARCGHWASQPHVYHQCSRVDKALSPQQNNANIGRTCYNQKTCGSREENSVCKRCVAADCEKLQRGTCMSVFSRGDRIKVLRTEEFAARMDKGKKRSSRELELKSPKSPSGFFRWGVQR